jgi:hypothetical protein
MHLSCTDTNTVSKWTETRFHMTHITKQFHQVCPKWFLSLWYVRRKPCNYLVSRLALYLNGPKQASTWALLPGSTIGCIQIDLWACGMFGANRAPIMHWHWHHLQTDQNELPLEPCHLGVPSGASKMISEPMVCSTQTVHLSCTDSNTVSKQTKTSFYLSLVTKEFHRVWPKWFLILWYIRCKPSTYLAPRLALSPNGLTLTLSPNVSKQDSTWPTSPSTFIACVQNDFWAYGTFTANLAPILHWD